jgi:hypothetical protein
LIKLFASDGINQPLVWIYPGIDIDLDLRDSEVDIIYLLKD